uniref:Uncharacterized protein n=1 Tax=Panagrolaimus sp. JU765 TaxID=591449 RepID=A0AC34QBF8_9BILA
MGYATYRVYKSGGGFEFLETDVALAFYALHAVLFVVCVFLYDSKNYKLLAILKGLALIAGIGTLVTYFLIDSTAGWISIPFAIAQAFCFFMALKLYQLNKNVPAKLPTTVAG